MCEDEIKINEKASLQKVADVCIFKKCVEYNFQDLSFVFAKDVSIMR